MSRRRTTGDTVFAAVHTEGAVLPPDLLARLVEGDGNLEGLSPDSYHLAGEKPGEAISRAWNRLLGVWVAFEDARQALPEADLGTSLTRERWLLPLFQELGYGRVQTHRAEAVGGKHYPISHRWGNLPIHLVGCRVDLDRRTPGVAGAARVSPHGLVQEFLNRSDDHLWAFLSNGLRLRILRDNVSLTRQAYVEFDLEAILRGELYSDFVLLWLLCHQSRVEAERPEECWLERWSREAAEQGTRALETLRNGVQQAIEALGRGFLAHPANGALKERLRSGDLPTQDYYRQLLRLVYRLLFLFAAEDRDLLLDPGAAPEARERYSRYYGTARLRKLAGNRRGGPHPDLYRGLRVVMGHLGTETGCPELGLPALGSFLWSDNAVSDLRDADIANRDLLAAVRALAFTERQRVLQPVNYRNLGSEELGSVYESLLELHPYIHAESATFELRTAAGHERKTTGSYYTPTSLIQCLLDSALDPVLDEAARKPDPEEAILALKVCDPACGSGHFLIAAAHRMARRLAAARSGDEESAPEATRHALRDVIGHCIYGVDINPMSVELCKVSLWLEALEPGRPLSFLDHHIQCGNSLLGTTPALIAKGIPDEAFKPIEGDDKEVCKEAKAQNKRERKEGEGLFGFRDEPWQHLGNLATAMAGLEEIEDDTFQGVKAKQARYEELVKGAGYLSGRFLSDAWCAAFVWKKRKEEGRPYPITQGLFRRIERNPHDCPGWMREEVQRLARQYGFFHWHLAFPDVFRVPAQGESVDNEQTGLCGGFDVVLGNPPWEHTELKEQEWFAERHPDIAEAPGARRKRMIERLEDDDPELYTAFVEAKREHDAVSHLVRGSERYPLCGRGRINTYAIFAEIKRSLLSPVGRVGCIVPSGIATDDTTKFFFQDLVEGRSLASLYDFENREAIFPGVHRSYKFCLLTMVGAARPAREGAEFAFFLHQVAELKDPDRRFRLSTEDIALINPNTRTCPIFRRQRDAEITKAIYRRVPVLVKEGPPEENPWGVSFRQGLFNMTSASALFQSREALEAEGWKLTGNVFEWEGERYLPLYEAKMVHHFDHRFGDYDDLPEGSSSTQLPDVPLERKQNPDYQPLPRYWVPEAAVDTRLEKTDREGNVIWRWNPDWLLGWRDITNTTNERTVIAGVVPRVGIGHTMPLFLTSSPVPTVAGMMANLSAFSHDFVARQKIGGTHLTYGYLNQLPVLPPTTYEVAVPWHTMSVGDWLLSRVLELTYTAWDLAPFARDCGWDGPPFRWDEERRFLLRCELDAAFFHLYLPADENGDWRPAEGKTAEDLAHLKASFLTPRDAVAYIMDTFPIVKRKDEQRHGEFRTKNTILQIYDALADSIRTGQPYQTVLDPPPADPRVAHPAAEEQSLPLIAADTAVPDLATVAGGAWARPQGVTDDNVALFALVAALRQVASPVDSARVRMAAILVRNPVLALPFMSAEMREEWKRVIGSEAQPLPANVVSFAAFQTAGADQAWAGAVHHLRGSGALTEGLDGQWSAGERLDQAPVPDWITGRAAVAVELVSGIDIPQAEQDIASFVAGVRNGTAG